MSYVDGFVLPVPKKKLKEYERIATDRRQGLEGPWRHRLPRMRRRRR